MSAPTSTIRDAATPQVHPAPASHDESAGVSADQGPILILSASAGAGHMVAAEALQSAFRERLPHGDVEIIDVLQLSNGFFRRLYAQGYLALVNHAPSAMGWLYEAMDRPDQEYRDWIRTAFQNINTRSTVKYLFRRRPSLIVNTHFLSAEIVAIQRRRYRLSCPQVTVTTDFETHRLWVQPPTERYYTATEEGKAYLVTWGVAPRDVHVTGIPVRAAFNQPISREFARRKHGLRLDQPVALLLCGGFGVGPTGELFRELMRMPPQVQLIVVTGHNEKLRSRLQARASRGSRTVVVVGFTDKMHEFMRAADVAITKPGGLTASEALVCGLPLVVVNPIPGQEARNSDFLLEGGAAVKVNNIRMLGYRVGSMLNDADRLAALRRRAGGLGRPDAAGAIVDDALQVLAKTRV